ncbi:hypothetical protein CYLTODRAFT_495316 [Cylindrobasidium torrendii FP15055 ss-10]|uniref:Uncharacterized protein n=1 Tax=Cylindrobasidium torrendii FP15055 ss-10 TaxID=1314674 RepID=A0A0D7ATZ4_9AGAR|nr:hypothetical protein CYLTODRAFT_495316 [Cylindrobasidium torrendii FP15055 ss-10]
MIALWHSILERGEQPRGAIKDDIEEGGAGDTVKRLPIPELHTPEKDGEKDSGKSDSPIGALRGELGPPSPTLLGPLNSEVEMTTKVIPGRLFVSSKIPRRLPGPRVRPCQIAFEYTAISGQHHAKRGHTKHKSIRRKPFDPNIEQSYTANIAPGYLPLDVHALILPLPDSCIVSGRRMNNRPGSPPPSNGNGSNLNPNKASQRFARANRTSDSKSAFRPNSTFKGNRINGTKVGRFVAGFEPKPLGRQPKLSITNGHRVRPGEEEETLSDAKSEADDEVLREPEEQSIKELSKRHDEDNSCVDPANDTSPPSAMQKRSPTLRNSRKCSRSLPDR